MKRVYAMLAAVLCALFLAGCSVLPESESSNVQPIFTATVMTSPAVTATPIQTPTPVPAITPSPQPTATLPPGIREEARFFEDLDGDGEDEKIIVSSEEESEAIYLILQDTGGYNQDLIEHGWFQSAFLTQTENEEKCLLVSIDLASEDYITFIYSFDNSEPRKYPVTAIPP